MRFKIVGANSETGDDVDIVMEAASQPEVEKLASAKGILVSSITQAPAPVQVAAPAPGRAANASPSPAGAHVQASHAPAAGASQASGTHAPGAAAPAHKAAPDKDFSTISLVDDEPPADGGDPNAPKTERAHGMITVNANSPSETAHTGAGTIQQAKHAEAAMEYHIILNQSLFLLESAVNKHLADGWEPQGGLSVGMANNALQFFQSMVRKKKPAAP